MIPQETVNLILDTARIEDVVGDFVTLKKRGASYVACCPFHNEKTPSFYVTPSKGIYKCFGCGKAGSSVRFVMEHEHCSYVEALRYLAAKYHIEVVEKEETAEDLAARQRNESLLLACEFAQKFFVAALDTPEGRNVARAYYRSRGLDDATVAKFGLGWAPSSRTALRDAALAAGYKEEYLIDAGLCVKHDDGRVLDKFYDRVTFPIHSVSGRVIAFSCRTLRSDNPAKYVNSPETEIYTKGKILYGIYFAKAEISRQDECILVEGNVDMVTMHQLGITNVVASCGTSLTVEQIRLIHKFTENVTIIYDGDSAGIHAALRGIDLVLAEGLNVRVVLLPDGEDPDSYCRKHSLEEVKAFISENARDFISFKADLLLRDAGKDPIRRANLINNISDTIAQVPDAVKRSVYVDTVAEKFKVESKYLFDRIASTRRNAIAKEKTISRPHPQASYDNAPQAAEELSVPALETNAIVGYAERDVLFFLLKHGRSELDFPVDSEFYSGAEDDKPTVAEFIRAYFEADDSVMVNEAYRKTYEAYMEMYDAGIDQDSIVRNLLNVEDQQIAYVAAQISVEKYQLTMKDFQNALTTTSSWLVTYVPKTLLTYAERKIEDRVVYLRSALENADADSQNEILAQIIKLQEAQKRIKIRIGRERNN